MWRLWSRDVLEVDEKHCSGRGKSKCKGPRIDRCHIEEVSGKETRVLDV